MDYQIWGKRRGEIEQTCLIKSIDKVRQSTGYESNDPLPNQLKHLALYYRKLYIYHLGYSEIDIRKVAT